MQIAAISGSLRAGSFNTKLLKAAAGMAPAGMTVEIVPLGDVPLYNGDEDQPGSQPQAALTLADKLRGADGILISTPEYNYSFSGVLKNAIDWLSRVQPQPFDGKPVGIIGAAAGQIGTARAQYHLRQVLVCLNPRVMARPEYFMGAAHTRFDEDGTLSDRGSADFLAKYMAAFKAWVDEHAG